MNSSFSMFLPLYTSKYLYVILCNSGSYWTYYFISLFSSSYVSSVTSAFGKVGKMHFCFTSKEIFVSGDHALCCLGNGAQQLLSFPFDSPTPGHANSPLFAPGIPPRGHHFLSLLPHGAFRFLCTSAMCPQLLAPTVRQKVPSGFAFDGLWGWKSSRSFGFWVKLGGGRSRGKPEILHILHEGKTINWNCHSPTYCPKGWQIFKVIKPVSC